jgi:2'-hydroxyisoflavone reductase
VAPWSGLPVWLPRERPGLHQVAIGRALATACNAGPLPQTLRDTAAWDQAAPAAPAGGPPRPPVGLLPEREAALLSAWRTRA